MGSHYTRTSPLIKFRLISYRYYNIEETFLKLYRDDWKSCLLTQFGHKLLSLFLVAVKLNRMKIYEIRVLRSN